MLFLVECVVSTEPCNVLEKEVHAILNQPKTPPASRPAHQLLSTHCAIGALEKLEVSGYPTSRRFTISFHLLHQQHSFLYHNRLNTKPHGVAHCTHSLTGQHIGSGPQLPYHRLLHLRLEPERKPLAGTLSNKPNHVKVPSGEKKTIE